MLKMRQSSGESEILSEDRKTEKKDDDNGSWEWISDLVLRIRNITFSFRPCEQARSLQLQQMAVFRKPERQRQRKSGRKNDFNKQEEKRDGKKVAWVNDSTREFKWRGRRWGPLLFGLRVSHCWYVTLMADFLCGLSGLLGPLKSSSRVKNWTMAVSFHVPLCPDTRIECKQELFVRAKQQIKELRARIHG